MSLYNCHLGVGRSTMTCCEPCPSHPHAILSHSLLCQLVLSTRGDCVRLELGFPTIPMPTLVCGLIVIPFAKFQPSPCYNNNASQTSDKTLWMKLDKGHPDAAAEKNIITGTVAEYPTTSDGGIELVDWIEQKHRHPYGQHPGRRAAH